jgi:ribokinase
MHPGGKGLNQSIAMAAVGKRVRHAGKVGEDGRWLLDLMAIKKLMLTL